MTVPTLILIGESDDWTPAEACRKLVDGQDDLGMTRQKGGQSAEPAQGLPERVSWFDFPSLRKPINYFGHHLEFNKMAADQSSDALREFLRAIFGDKLRQRASSADSKRRLADLETENIALRRELAAEPKPRPRPPLPETEAVAELERQLKAARTRIKNLTAEASRAWAVANANPATISKAAHRKLKKVFHPDPEHATATPERWAHITLSHIQKTQNLVAQNARCSIVLQPTFRLRGKTALAAASRHHRRS